MVENQTEIVTTWSEHPTVIVTGTVIKTIQAPFTIDDLKKEATLLQKCQAFTSLGHLLTDITNVDDWMYDKNTVSYLKKQTKLTKEVKEVKQTKLTKEVKEVKEEKATKTGSNVIPKIMHMLYNTENFALMPSNVRNMIVYNVENLNDWDYRLYTPDKTLSFVDKEYPELKEVYTMLHPKQKYELMKILLVNKYGGVYINILLKLDRNINMLRKKPRTIILNKQDNTISGIVAQSDDDLLCKIIDLYKEHKSLITNSDVIDLINSYQDVTVIK